MRIVSPFLKKIVYPSMSKAGLFHRGPAGGLAVVTYHGVFPAGYEPVDPALDGNLVSAEMLSRQLRLLKAHYDVVSPEDVLAWRKEGRALPSRAVLLTCDDGLLNCLTDMLPVLREEAVRCLFFVTGASARQSRRMMWYEDLFLLMLRAPGGPFEISCDGVAIQGELGSREQRRAVWWNAVKRLSQVDAQAREAFLRFARTRFGLSAQEDLDSENSAFCRRFGLMTVAEVGELASAGMTIGAHTLSHPMLSQGPSDMAYSEVAESRRILETALKKQIWAFAYPFGDSQSVTPQILDMPRDAGFAAAFLNFGGGLGTPLPDHALPRVHVTADMSLGEFEAHVSGFYGWLSRRAGRNANSAGLARA